MAINLLSCVFDKVVIPQRWVLIALVHLALLNAYHLRVVLNIAMMEMRKAMNHSSKIDACPMYKPQEVPVKEGKFDWPNQTEALILYAFYIGYIVSHIPGGWLADKLGAKHVLGVCMLTSAITNLLYPLAIKWTGYVGAIVFRVIVGLAQGPIIPTISVFIQCWIPGFERSFVGAIAYGGSNLGTVTGGILTGTMIHSTNSWGTPFYVWAVLTLVWYIFYWFWAYSTPSQHPYITEKEAEFLETSMKIKKHPRTPWLHLVKSMPVWALVSGQIGHNILFFTLFTNLPKFMKEILKLDMILNSIFFAVPFLTLWLLTFVFAYFAEVLETRYSISLIWIRRIFTFFSSFVPSVLLILIPYFGCNRVIVLTLQTLSVGLIAPFFPGMKININDLTIHHGGVIMAFVNGFGAISGIVGPFIVGALTTDESLEQWATVYLIMGGISTFCALFYVVFASAQRQAWDFLNEENVSNSLET